MQYAKLTFPWPGDGLKTGRKNCGPSNSATVTPRRQSTPAAYMCWTTFTTHPSINSVSLSPADRETLAAALASTPLGKFDSLEPTLRRYSPAKAAFQTIPSAVVGRGICRLEKCPWKACLADNRNQLINALRNDLLDYIDRSADTMRVFLWMMAGKFCATAIRGRCPGVTAARA